VILYFDEKNQISLAGFNTINELWYSGRGILNFRPPVVWRSKEETAAKMLEKSYCLLSQWSF